MKSSRDPHPGPNSAFPRVTDTPSTSLSAAVSGAPGYPSGYFTTKLEINPERPKITAAFVPDGFEPIPAPTDD